MFPLCRNQSVELQSKSTEWQSVGLLSRANHLPGFYIMGALVVKGLKVSYFQWSVRLQTRNQISKNNKNKVRLLYCHGKITSGKNPRVSTEKSANHSIDINFSEFSNMIINGEEKGFTILARFYLIFRKTLIVLATKFLKLEWFFRIVVDWFIF